MNRITQEQAVATLQAMFAHVDAEVLLMVLESNGGHMERTVEALLSMDGSGSGSGAAPPPPVAAARAPPPPVRSYLPENFDAPAPAMSKPPLKVPTHSSALNMFDDLPQDFLRPPSFFLPTTQAARRRAAGLAASQEEQDRILATLLQDQMFMEGLRQNPSLLDARTSERERTEIADFQAREQRAQVDRHRQANARELQLHRQAVARQQELIGLEANLPSTLHEPGPVSALRPLEAAAAAARPSSDGYGAVPGDDEDPEAAPVARELTFGEKLSLLSDAAKQKLRDFFSSDADKSAASSSSSSTYHNLSSLNDDDSSIGGPIAAEQEMSELGGGRGKKFHLDHDDAYLFDDPSGADDVLDPPSGAANGQQHPNGPMLLPHRR